MTEITTDERGRLTIPKEIRERHGERYRLIELESGIKLVSVPDDPVAELRAAASDELRNASLEALTAAAREEAIDETEEHVR